MIPLIFPTFLRDVISTKTMIINTITSAKKKVKIKQARGKMIKSKFPYTNISIYFLV